MYIKIEKPLLCGIFAISLFSRCWVQAHHAVKEILQIKAALNLEYVYTLMIDEVQHRLSKLNRVEHKHKLN